MRRLPYLVAFLMIALAISACSTSSSPSIGHDYNVIFRDESGNATDAQLLAFDDTTPCASS